MTAGIYQIRNTINNKIYIGSSKNLTKRQKVHWNTLKSKSHHNDHLKRSCEKYGIQSFVFEIIKLIDNPTPILLFIYESFYINSMHPEYNIGGVGGGDCISMSPRLNEFKCKQSTLQKIRYANMTNDEKLNHSKNISRDKNPNWRGGKTFFICPICKIEIRIGGSRNQKTCSKCVDRTGKNNTFFGKTHSEESKIKMSLSNTGKTMSNEAKINLAKSVKIFWASDAGEVMKSRISKKMSGENHPLYGIGHNEQSKKKMSDTKKNNFKNMGYQEKCEYYSKKKSLKLVRIKDDYFFSLSDATLLTKMKLSKTALEFRCKSKDQKWKDYEIMYDQTSISDKLYITHQKYNSF